MNIYGLKKSKKIASCRLTFLKKQKIFNESEEKALKGKVRRLNSEINAIKKERSRLKKK